MPTAYFVEATAQAKAKLKAYSETAPDEVQTWRNRAQEAQEGRSESAASDEDIKLHAKYQDWFVAEFSLDKQLKQWERRLGALTDRSTSLREARERITDVRLYISEESGLAGASRDFEHFIYFLLGLGGFADGADDRDQGRVHQNRSDQARRHGDHLAQRHLALAPRSSFHLLAGARADGVWIGVDRNDIAAASALSMIEHRMLHTAHRTEL